MKSLSILLILALTIPVINQKIFCQEQKEPVIDVSQLSKKEEVKPSFTDKEMEFYNKSLDLINRVKRWEKIVLIASKRYSVDKNLIRSVIAAESGGYVPDTSSAGARSIMQLLPSTAEDLGVKDIDNPFDNILGGTKYLRNLLKMFDNNEELALASYNAGAGAVLKYNGVPPYKETMAYVKSVKEYKKLFEMHELLAAK
jgi:soluble lytic murein transglycosylase-like protein